MYFKLVLAAANRYQTVFNIQMAATACLFNLSKNEIGQKLHPRILGQIVKVKKITCSSNITTLCRQLKHGNV
jgi:hypothetical protein